MLAQIVVFAGGLLAVLGVVVVLGWRVKSPLVLGPVVRLSRALINPRQLRTAGTAGVSTSVVQHLGRKSGRAYETPVDAVPVDGGFLIALPYGSRTSWVRNVLASGSATILRDGARYAVDRPEIVATANVADHFSRADQRGFRLLRIDQCLRLRTIAADSVSRVEPATLADIARLA